MLKAFTLIFSRSGLIWLLISAIFAAAVLNADIFWKDLRAPLVEVIRAAGNTTSPR